MHRPLLPLLTLALALLLPAFPVRAANAPAVAFRLKSPDENTIGIGGEIANRVIRYDPKRKELNVILNISYEHYASTGSMTNEDLYFTFPGVLFDPETKILSVKPPPPAPGDGKPSAPAGGDAVPIGEWKEGGLGGHTVLLYETTVFVTTRDRTSIKLSIDYDSTRTVEVLKKKAEAEESQPVTEQLK